MSWRKRVPRQHGKYCHFCLFSTPFCHKLLSLLFLCFYFHPVNCELGSNSSEEDIVSIRLSSTVSSPLQEANAVYNVSISGSVTPTLFTNCKSDHNSLWPPDPPGPTLVLGFLMTLRGFIMKERLGLKIPGMISYAVERINSMRVLPENYTLQIQVKDTKGNEILSTKYVTDMVCNNISAFIGPESSCFVEASIAEAQNIPMISYACTDSKAGDRNTFARTNPSETHILRATIETIVHFNWTKFSIIYENNGFNTMAKTLQEMALQRNLTVNHMLPFQKEKDFPNIFIRTKHETRIYVIIGHRQIVPRALQAMTLSGLLSKEKKDYFLLYVDREEFTQENWIQYFYEPTTIDQIGMQNVCLLEELEAYEYAFMVITNTLPRNIESIEDRTREYNKKEPFCLASDVKEVLNRLSQRKDKVSQRLSGTTQHVPFLPASYLYDAVFLYATAVRELYDEAVERAKITGEKADVKSIGRNGTAVIDKLTNRTFSSILGFNVTMGADRASEGSYSVYYLQRSEECKKPEYHSKISCISPQCLVNISDFRYNKLKTNLSIPIKDEPLCGYSGDLCGQESTRYKLISSVVLAVLVCILMLFSILKYRHWKYELEISGLLWRIDKDKLKFNHNDCLTQSKMSIMSGVSQDGTYANFVSLESRATYRGTMCCIKTIKLEHKKQELSRDTMKNMRLMREIKHRNVCPFIGAYVEERKLTLVTEYANRGSLEDILENEDIRLDSLFISSLVQDLLRAMCFLHQTFGSHGNLKSSNCVVTGRWVLQVTDYNLYKLRYEAYKAMEKKLEIEMEYEEIKKHLKSCLWKSPELLRQHNFIPGTKEGDVYAFGIILHEIIGRKGPFSTSDCNGYPNYEGIIEDVKRGHSVSGTLCRPNTLDLALMPYGGDPDVLHTMKSTWAEDHKIRPDFKEITVKLKMMKKSGNLVDHMVVILEEHNKNLEGLVRERTMEVFEEKKKTEELLHSMLPSSVAMSLCCNVPVEPQSYDSVTIYFSDIVGFTALASTSSPFEIVSFLDDLYREFDTTIRGFDVYKVETIGDAYMVVSGLPNRNEGRHAGEIASMSLELLELTKSFKIKHKPDQILKLRIGLHTGPVIAGVVGHTMPRYCLFGDTVNTASRMESNGEPLRIHISKQCKEALTVLGGYVVEERGYVEMKGKGAVLTYWLNAANEGAIRSVEYAGSTVGFFQRHADDNKEVRRRSPRHSGDRSWIKRPSSVGSQKLNEGEFVPSTPRVSPIRDLASHHRKRLSGNLRASSLESPTHAGFLSPPQSPLEQQEARTSSCGSVRESYSLDHIPNTITPSNPCVRNLRRSSSPSSEPSLVVNVPPKVNFYSSAISRDVDDATSELNPMLEYSCQDESDFEDDRTGSQSSIKKASLMKNIFLSIIPNGKKERLTSEKSSINGLQRESHV